MSFSQTNDAIHVAFGLSDATGTYSKYVATTILSLLVHTSSRVIIHILHDDTLSMENRSKLEKTIQIYDAKILYHHVEIPAKVNGLDSLRQITIGTLFRLFIPSICENIDKIIYLDADIIVQCDLKSLWDIDLSGKCLAAVKDVLETQKKYINSKTYKMLGVTYLNYFNAGVLVFNCKEIREKIDLPTKGIALLLRYTFLPFADQDALNILFQDEILYLNECFNHQVDISKCNLEKDMLQSSKGILHFSGYIKPWNCNNSEIIKFYYDYLIKTAFASNCEEICNIMSFISFDYSQKMDFKHFILCNDEQASLMNRFFCLLRMILPTNMYSIICRKIWDIRQMYRYNYKIPRIIKSKNNL